MTEETKNTHGEGTEAVNARIDNDIKGNPTYVSIPLLKLSSEKVLPGAVYICLRHKIVRYRNAGDALTANEFNKLVYSQVRFVFIDESERPSFEKWFLGEDSADRTMIEKQETEEAKSIAEVSIDQRRAMMDLFQSPKDDKQVKVALDTSKKLVTEFLKKPFAINNIAALQKYGKGCVDHSVNVSVLSVFLGIRMGYTHKVILDHLAMGGLFHDIGKILIEATGDILDGDDDPAMQEHPRLGADLLEKSKNGIPKEVTMIVAQHHEFLDGSGYPARLKGLAIYDLARIIAIANVFDNLISESAMESIKDRATEALDRMEKEFDDRLDAKKLEKAVKILRFSLL